MSTVRIIHWPVGMKPCSAGHQANRNPSRWAGTDGATSTYSNSKKVESSPRSEHGWLRSEGVYSSTADGPLVSNCPYDRMPSSIKRGSLVAVSRFFPATSGSLSSSTSLPSRKFDLNVEKKWQQQNIFTVMFPRYFELHYLNFFQTFLLENTDRLQFNYTNWWKLKQRTLFGLFLVSKRLFIYISSFARDQSCGKFCRLDLGFPDRNHNHTPSTVKAVVQRCQCSTNEYNRFTWCWCRAAFEVKKLDRFHWWCHRCLRKAP